MPERLTGGCHCGSVRYEVEASLADVVACHCEGCQRQSGSAFGLSLGVSPEAFRLLSGELHSFEVACDSGRTKRGHFCPGCGARIYNRGEWGLSLKGGTLDDAQAIVPKAHFWTARKQRWVSLPTSVPRFVDDG